MAILSESEQQEYSVSLEMGPLQSCFGWLVFKWCLVLLPDRHQMLHISSFDEGLLESVSLGLVNEVTTCGMLRVQILYFLHHIVFLCFIFPI